MKTRMAEVAGKARMMIGIGKITKRTLTTLEEELGCKKSAEKRAIKNFLKEKLDFNDEELEIVKILDTKVSSSEDVVYFVAGDHEHIKELHHRRAVVGDEDIMIRDYVPPQYHDRYMALVRRSKEKRNEDRSLKTQIRWGHKDVEIFTKQRGTEERFQKAGLKEFMGENVLPEFDTNRVWKERKDTGLRRRIYSKQQGQTTEVEHPSNGQQKRQGIVRQLSTSSKAGEGSKKLRNNSMEVGSKCLGDDSGDDRTQEDDMELNGDGDEVL